MRIVRGSARVVLVFPKIVIKIPWSNVHVSLRVAKKHPLKTLKAKFYWGIRENWQEFITWMSLKAPFLTPVYFSIGLVSIQKRARETSRKDTKGFTERLDRVNNKTNHQLREELNFHSVGEENWIQENWGYQMVDFGGSPVGLPLRTFLARWQKVLEEEMKV